MRKVRMIYRTRPKLGLYYVAESRFKKDVKALIEFHKSEVVRMDKLTDDDARHAGVRSAKELRSLFLKWYGRIPDKVHRNWFRLVKVLG